MVLQDTVCGFLMGGVGELDKSRRPNFLVVDKSKYSQLVSVFNRVLPRSVVSADYLSEESGFSVL